MTEDTEIVQGVRTPLSDHIFDPQHGEDTWHVQLEDHGFGVHGHFVMRTDYSGTATP